MTTVTALELNRRLSRQSAMVNRAISDISVCIVGVGGIGSNAAHTLASMGVQQLTLIDNGIVEPENIYPGFFSQDAAQEELKKVDAVSMDIEDRYGVLPLTRLGFIEDVPQKDLGIYDIVLVCTDTLASRQATWKALGDRATWWLDGRMGGPGCDLYCFNTKDGSKVEAYLESLEHSEGELPCGMKATAFITKGYLQGFIGDAIRDIVNDEPVAPFRWRYSADDKLVVVEPGVEGWTNWLTYRISIGEGGANGTT